MSERQHAAFGDGHLNAVRLWVVPGLAVSVLGAWYHNVQEGIASLSIETLSVLIAFAVLAAWWWWTPGRILWAITVVWVLVLNLLVGAVLSVLPLPIWPFAPEQTASHYLAHVVYLLTQLPATYALWLTRPTTITG